jgi:hypothetical protein
LSCETQSLSKSQHSKLNNNQNHLKTKFQKQQQQQLDRHEESLRSSLRAVAALDALPGSAGALKWAAFMQRTPLGPALRDKLAAVKREREESAAAAATAAAV